MNIVLVGNIAGTSFGMEVSDEALIADELELAGHTVTRIEHKKFDERVQPMGGVDLVWVSKHLELTPKRVAELKVAYRAPVVIWMSDHFDLDGKNIKQRDVFLNIWKECDLLLVRQKELLDALDREKVHYAYDCLDTAPATYRPIHDEKTAWRNPQRRFPNPVPVGFVGNWIHEPSFRNAYVKVLADAYNENFCLTTITMSEYRDNVGVQDSQIFHPMYGIDFSKLVDLTLVNLSVENFLTRGFWSNRIARILRSKGFCMVVGAPDLEERFGPDGENIVYLPEDPFLALEKINKYLNDPVSRKDVAHRGWMFAEQHLTMKQGVERMFATIKENL